MNVPPQCFPHQLIELIAGPVRSAGEQHQGVPDRFEARAGHEHAKQRQHHDQDSGHKCAPEYDRRGLAIAPQNERVNGEKGCHTEPYRETACLMNGDGQADHESQREGHRRAEPPHTEQQHDDTQEGEEPVLAGHGE